MGHRSEKAGEADEDFRAFMAARAHGLRRTAYALCGDWHHAEDLTQIAFTKVYAAWPRVRAADNVEAYLRRTLTNAYIDETRRGWRREQPSDSLPDREAEDRSDGFRTERVVLVHPDGSAVMIEAENAAVVLLPARLLMAADETKHPMRITRPQPIYTTSELTAVAEAVDAATAALR